MNACVFVCMYGNNDVSMDVCTHACYICLFLHVCMYACMYVCRRTHTHTGCARAGADRRPARAGGADER